MGKRKKRIKLSKKASRKDTILTGITLLIALYICSIVSPSKDNSASEPTPVVSGLDAAPVAVVASDTPLPATDVPLLASDTPLPTATTGQLSVPVIVTNTPSVESAPVISEIVTDTVPAAPASDAGGTGDVNPAVVVSNLSAPVVNNAASPVPTIVPPVAGQPTTRYYVINQANVRTCPRLDCSLITTHYAGAALDIVNETIQGDAFREDTRWMQGVTSSGTVFYVHSLLVDRNPPATAQPIIVNPPVNSFQPTLPEPAQQELARPANCTEAVAWGYTAQQAAQWSHLDRDGDGVACYGD